jgi:hypothetical protein
MSDQHEPRAGDEEEIPATSPEEQPAAWAEDEVQGYIQSVDAGEAALPTVEDAQNRPARTVRNPVSG